MSDTPETFTVVNDHERVVAVYRHPVDDLEPARPVPISARLRGRLEVLDRLLDLFGTGDPRITLAALKILLHRETRGGEEIARELGCTRAGINAAVNRIARRLGLPTERGPKVHRIYSERQKAVWRTGKRKRPLEPAKETSGQTNEVSNECTVSKI